MTIGDALDDWAFNVMLECSGREDDRLEMAIGGAILDLRDLHRVLEWARGLALAAAARQGGDVQQAPGEAPQSGPNESEGNAQ